jgi:hypothetical protein
MESFDNFERWMELKDNVAKRPDIIEIIQNVLLYRSPFCLKTWEEVKAEYIGSGRSREIYRIGEGRSHTIEVASKELVLALKVPYYHWDWFGSPTYKSEEEFIEAAKEETKWEPNRFFSWSIELNRFQALGLVGANIPFVTGLVSGFHKIANLTEDLTEGGIYEVNEKDVNCATKIHPDGREEVFYVDGKHYIDKAGFPEDRKPYIANRLRADTD